LHELFLSLSPHTHTYIHNEKKRKKKNSKAINIFILCIWDENQKETTTSAATICNSSNSIHCSLDCIVVWWWFVRIRLRLSHLYILNIYVLEGYYNIIHNDGNYDYKYIYIICVEMELAKKIEKAIVVVPCAAA
jgi:hypothetical protein